MVDAVVITEVVFVDFAQQQVPLIFLSAEQQQPDRRPTFAAEKQPPEAPTGSNGQTTDVSTYKAIAHQTRHRIPLVDRAGTRTFVNRS